MSYKDKGLIYIPSLQKKNHICTLQKSCFSLRKFLRFQFLKSDIYLLIKHLI